MIEDRHQRTSAYGRPAADAEQQAGGRTENPYRTMIKAGDKLVGGRYEVLSMYSGGMGVVYKCHDEVTDTVVALKTIETEGAMSELKIRLMKRNYKLVHGLSHKHIVHVNILERDDATGQWFLSMDWVDGEDLESRLRRPGYDNRLPAEEVVRLLRQVAEALDYAHGESVVHRDVKCANIMVTGEGDAQLIDFGIAGRAPATALSDGGTGGGESTTWGNLTTGVDPFSGTRGYQSPEQWTGQKATASSDQYSLAVTAYRCLAGHLPFWNSNEGQLMELVLHQEVPSVVSLPPAANAALSKALSKDSEARYGSCVEFMDALAAGLGIRAVPEKREPIDVSDFYIFAGAMDRCRQKCESMEWDRGQTFGRHLDAFSAACTAAASARVERDYEAAYDFLKQGESEWQWLERNIPLRERASERLAEVRKAHGKADLEQSERYADKLYKEALRKEEAVLSDFESGSFDEAVDGSYIAEGKFGEAVRMARVNRVGELEKTVHDLLSQGKFGACDAVLRELASVDKAKADELSASVANERSGHVRRLEEDIRRRVSEKDFTGVDDILRELAALDGTVGGKCAADIKAAKAERVRELVQLIDEAVAGRRFDEAAQWTGELAPLDSVQAEGCGRKVSAAKASCIQAVLEKIHDLAGRNLFDDCGAAIEELAALDSSKAVEMTSFVESAKASRIGELSASVEELVSKRHYQEAFAALDELSVLDGAKADGLRRAVEESKSAAIRDIEKQIGEALFENCFPEADGLVRQLEALQAETTAKWRDAVASAKSVRIHDLERLVNDMTVHGEYGRAEAAVLELRALDAGKADACEAVVRDAKSAETGRLRRIIGNAVSECRFAEAEAAADELSRLDEELGKEAVASIHAAFAAETERLKRLVAESVSENRFDDAEEAIRTLRSLDSAAADECSVSVVAAKSNEIGRLERLVLESVKERRFEEAERAVRDLWDLDAEKAEGLKDTVVFRRSEYVLELEHDIGEAIIGRRFDRVAEAIGELSKLDKAKSDKWFTIAEEARSEAVRDLTSSIERAIGHGRYDVAEGLVRQLEPLDAEEAGRLSSVVSSAKNDRIEEILSHVRAAVDEHHYDDALHLLQPLSDLDADAYGRWEADVQRAKSERIAHLKDEAAEAIAQRRFDEAETTCRELSSLDGQEGRRMAEAVSAARKEYVEQLDKAITDAVGEKHFADADAKLAELRGLDSAKAEERTEEVLSSRRAYVSHLDQIASEAIGGGQLTEAEQTVGELLSLDAEKGEVRKRELDAALEKHRQEVREKRRKAIIRLTAIACGVCAVVVLVVALIIGAMLRRQYVLKKVVGLHEHLTSQEGDAVEWSSLDGKVVRLRKALEESSKGSALSADVYKLLADCDMSAKAYETFKRDHDDLNAWVGRLYGSSLRSEWERKSANLLEGKEWGDQMDKTVDDYSSLMAARDDRLLQTMKRFADLSSSFPSVVEGLAHSDHETGLKAIREYIGLAREILVWYDERNTVGLPTEVDQAWVGDRGAGDHRTDADWRQDALAKAAELKTAMTGCDRWEAWCAGLWNIDKVWKDNGFSAFRDKLGDLKKAVNQFGGFKEEFGKALEEAADAVYRKEAVTMTERVVALRHKAEKIVAQIGDRAVIDMDCVQLAGCRYDVVKSSREGMAESSMARYLGEWRKDREWLEGVISTAGRLVEEGKLVHEAEALLENAKRGGSLEKIKQVGAFVKECQKALGRMEKLDGDVFAVQRDVLTKRLEAFERDARDWSDSKAISLLERSVKEYLKKCDDLKKTRDGRKADFEAAYQAISEVHKQIMDSGGDDAARRSVAAMKQAKAVYEEMQPIFEQMAEFEKTMDILQKELDGLAARRKAFLANGGAEELKSLWSDYESMKKTSHGAKPASDWQQKRREQVMKEAKAMTDEAMGKMKAAVEKNQKAFDDKVKELGVMVGNLAKMEGEPVSSDRLNGYFSGIDEAHKKLKESILAMVNNENREELFKRKVAAEKALDSANALHQEGMVYALYHDLSDVVLENRSVSDANFKEIASELRRLHGAKKAAQAGGGTAAKESNGAMAELQKRQVYLISLRSLFLDGQIPDDLWRDLLLEGQRGTSSYGRLSADLALWSEISDALKRQAAVLKGIDEAALRSKLEQTGRRLEESAKAVTPWKAATAELQTLGKQIDGLMESLRKGEEDVDRMGGRLPDVGAHSKRMRSDFDVLSGKWKAMRERLDADKAELDRLVAFDEFLPLGIAIRRQAEALTRLYGKLRDDRTGDVKEFENQYKAFNQLCDRAQKIANLPHDIVKLLDECRDYEKKYYGNAMEVLKNGRQ